MDINNIKLGKIQGKNPETKKAEEKSFQIPEDRIKDPSVLDKLRKSAASYALAALMTAGSLTSCMEQNQTMDTSGLEALLYQFMEQQKAYNEELIRLQKENNADNKVTQDLLRQLITQQNSINTILTNLYGDFENFDNNVMSAMYKIVALLEKSNSNDEEFKALLQKILDSNLDNGAKLDAILEANKEQNEFLLNLAKLIDESNGDMKEIIQNFYDDYKEGDATKSELLKNIIKELNKSNELSQQQLDAINAIQKQLEAGQISEAEALAKITAILESIDNKLGSLLVAVENLGTGNASLEKAIKEFHQDFKDDSITENALLAKILTAIETYGAQNPEILGELIKIREAIENGETTVQEGFNDVTDLLNKINQNTETIISKIDNISTQLGDISLKVEENQDESLAILKNINDGIGSIGTKLDQIELNQKADNKVMVEISNKIDQLNANLTELNDKSLTKADIKDLLGPLYTDISEIKNKIDGLGNNITIEDLKDILEGYKTDLTKTNSLIQTLTNVVQNLNLNGDSAAIQELADILNEIKAGDKADRAAIAAQLEEIIAKLGNIDDNTAEAVDLLKALQTTAKEIKASQDQYFNDARKAGADMLNEIKNIGNGVGDVKVLLENANDYTAALQEAEQTRQEMLAIMKSILANQGKDNGNGDFSIDYNKLKEILPDYSSILQEIRDAIGNVITSSDLENFFIKTQPDLTKTNSLIQTLTNVIQNKNFSGGSGSTDMSRVETLLGQLIDTINSKKFPTEAQIQELIDAAKQVVTNTSASSTAPASKSLATALNDIQEQIYKLTGEKGTYYLDPATIYSRINQA